MSWLPQFLNPWTALIAGSAAAAVLVALYFLKLRRQERPVSSTLLWKKAIQDLQVNAPFQRLRRNLLLILQLLMLLLLAAALARPVVDFTPSAGATNIILIDHSGSMNATDAGEGRTRLEEAKRRARDLINTMDRHARTMVIAFADSADIVQPFTSDRAELRHAVDSIMPTDRPTRLKLAAQLIDAQGPILAKQAKAWLYSDGRAADRGDVHFKVPLIFDPIGSDQSPNIAVVALDGRRNFKQPEQVEIFCRLANFGPKPAKADVELKVDGQVAAVKSVSLPPARWDDPQWAADHPGERDVNFIASDSIDFTLDLASSGVITVEQMNKKQDDLPADDAASLIVPPPNPLRVLLVTPGNYFLERALHSIRLKNLSIVSPEEYVKRRPDGFDVFIFDRYAPAADSLPAAGRFIDIDAVPQGMTLKIAKRGDRPIVLHNLKVLDWKRDHPILRQLMLDRLYVASALKLQTTLSDQVLIDGTDGPLMLLHQQGQGLHLIIPFDLLQSNWPVQLSFPIFMHNALQYMALGSSMDIRRFYRPGESPDIPRAEVLAADSSLKPIVVSGPDGQRSVAVPREGDLVLPPLERVGIYQLTPAIAGRSPVAVNMLDAEESNLMPAVREDAPHAGQIVQNTAVRGRLDLWWWIIACLFLPLMLLEWYVYTRRAHL